MSDSALQALSILRDGSHFQWYVIPLLAFVFYVYTVEAEKRNWNLILAALAFWGMDWFNEIWNGLVLRFTGYAPVWGEPGPTAYLILVGLNIETMFMFAVAGIVLDLEPEPFAGHRTYARVNVGGVLIAIHEADSVTQARQQTLERLDVHRQIAIMESEPERRVGRPRDIRRGDAFIGLPRASPGDRFERNYQVGPKVDRPVPGGDPKPAPGCVDRCVVRSTMGVKAAARTDNLGLNSKVFPDALQCALHVEALRHRRHVLFSQTVAELVVPV